MGKFFSLICFTTLWTNGKCFNLISFVRICIEVQGSNKEQIILEFPYDDNIPYGALKVIAIFVWNVQAPININYIIAEQWIE